MPLEQLNIIVSRLETLNTGVGTLNTNMGTLDVSVGTIKTALDNVVSALNGQTTYQQSAVLDHEDWTDGGAAAGTIDAGITIPALSILEAIKLEWTEAPDVDGSAGETTMTLSVGDGSDADRLNQATDPATTIATGLPASFVQDPRNPGDAGDGDIVFASATPLTITGTLSGGTPDFSNFVAAGGAGKLKLTVIYRALASL